MKILTYLMMAMAIYTYIGGIEQFAFTIESDIDFISSFFITEDAL